MSATPGGADIQDTGTRLGLKAEMVVQELGWDEDADDALRMQVEDAIDGDMVDGDYGNVVEAVLLWWRDDDGDLVDGLVDSLTDLVEGGFIWLLTPKVGRPGAVDAADVAEAADRLHDELAQAGVEVLYDDRDVSPGSKFADADLLGIPVQLVIGAKGLARGVVERKIRVSGARDEVALGDPAAIVLAL